jgi:hypothetical protein
MTLVEWHERLHRHFGKLRSARSASHAVFALEHGLTPEELGSIASDIRAHIATAPPRIEQALPWIVYATEVGYKYAGDEYWQTFEEETPGWTDYGTREWIRDRFRWFSRQFNGAEPKGTWAKKFSIICWPITHAVLPCDLQRQLARILYELRHSFAAEVLKSPARLGELIAARSWSGTSRFQNFAEETLLVGQIASALLLPGEPESTASLYPATLRRIGEDLERERLARRWLHEARHVAHDRLQVHGLSIPRPATTRAVTNRETARAEVNALGLEPRLVLEPSTTNNSDWEVFLEIPDLSSLLFRFPDFRNILSDSRCTVAGAAGRPLARGRVLRAFQRVLLNRWPLPEEILLQFEKSDPQLEYLLRTDSLLRPGPRWLFRIASDGLAYEMRGLSVRAGQRYIVVGTNDSFTPHSLLRPIKSSCEGVQAALLELSTSLSREFEVGLQQLGIGLARTIQAWPAGLAAIVWDGEGTGEWLASERPCIGIRADHPLDSLIVQFGSNEDLLEIEQLPQGEVVFVELPVLPVGVHKLRISSRGKAAGAITTIGVLDVRIRVREARPWTPGVSPQGLLMVEVDPMSPTLEQLWEGRVEIALRGPSARQVRFEATLIDSAGSTLTRQLPPLALPVTPDQWRDHFDKFFRRAKDIESVYDLARACDLKITAEEFGFFNLRCERAFTALRWIVRQHDRRHVVRLLDDSGEATQLSVCFMSFESPTTEEPLSGSLSYDVPQCGGLYVARRGDSVAAVIARREVHGFPDLQFTPVVAAQNRSPETIVRLLRLVSLWQTATISGNIFSVYSQRKVLEAIIRHIFFLIAGQRWHAAEIVFRDSSRLEDLKRSVSRRRDEAGLTAALTIECDRLAKASCAERVARLTQLASRFLRLPSSLTPRRPLTLAVVTHRGRRVLEDRLGAADAGADDLKWLCEFALRIASDPAYAESWAGSKLHQGVAELLNVPTIAKAARYFVLAIDNKMRSQTEAGRTRAWQFYAGWSWS